MPQTPTFIIGDRSLKHVLAGLYLLTMHAADGYPSPEVLEVGERFTNHPEMSEAEILALIRELSSED